MFCGYLFVHLIKESMAIFSMYVLWVFVCAFDKGVHGNFFTVFFVGICLFIFIEGVHGNFFNTFFVGVDSGLLERKGSTPRYETNVGGCTQVLKSAERKF